MFELSNNSIIYIVAPPFLASGGPELLHQLCEALRKQHFDARIYYYDRNNKVQEYKNPVHQQFLHYDIKIAKSVEDNENNLLIVPEKITSPLKEYRNIQKCIWWLGIEDYFKVSELYPHKYLRTLYHWLCYILGRNTPLPFIVLRRMQNVQHLAQSWYAVSYLERRKIPNAAYLSDYISQVHISESQNITEYNNLKQDIILYNPKRHYGYVKTLQKLDQSLKFVPIVNMTPKQVADLMKRAKVYIDFGSHPGKDRMPREAALYGCCILTSTIGSAGFWNDVPIDNEFKFKRTKKNLKRILKKIYMIFENYEYYSKKFDEYRKYIKNEKNIFEYTLSTIFTKD